MVIFLKNPDKYIKKSTSSISILTLRSESLGQNAHLLQLSSTFLPRVKAPGYAMPTQVGKWDLGLW